MGVMIVDNDEGMGTARGFTRYVTIDAFDKYCEQNDEDHRYIKSALWGDKGTNGMVKDIHDMKMYIKFSAAIVSVLLAVIIPVAIKLWFG